MTNYLALELLSALLSFESVFRLLLLFPLSPFVFLFPLVDSIRLVWFARKEQLTTIKRRKEELEHKTTDNNRVRKGTTYTRENDI